MRERGRSSVLPPRRWLVAVRLSLAALLSWSAGIGTLALPSVPRDRESLRIYFIDVEGGQSTLIITPDGESLLVDAGYNSRRSDPGRIVDAMHDAGISRIDRLVVTHFHPDHVGGIPELAERVPIGT